MCEKMGFMQTEKEMRFMGDLSIFVCVYRFFFALKINKRYNKAKQKAKGEKTPNRERKIANEKRKRAILFAALSLTLSGT